MANRPNKLARGYTQYQSVPLPERWPLVTDQETRSASEPIFLEKDARLVNCYAELNAKTQDYQVEKRPGSILTFGLTGGGNGLGIYSWLNNLYSVSGTKLFKDTAAFASVLDNGSYYRFSQLLGATPKLVLKNNTQGWFTDGTTLTQIIDVDYPATTVPGIAYLDGTTYVMRPDGGIQGSGIDDVINWDPLNVIIARNEPDKGIALFKHGTYVIALKEWSTQAFYNAGNATGSPLGRVDGFMQYYGCRNGNSVVEMDGMHFWITASKSAGSQLAKLEDLNLSIVSNPVVDRILTEFGTASVGFGMKLGGHRFIIYLLSSAGFSLVYDVDQKLYYRWTNYSADNVWPFISSTYFGNLTYAQHLSDTGIYIVDTDFAYPTDSGHIFPVDIYTGNFDFGIDRRKTLNWMCFDADIVQGSTLQVRNSDDDYTNWTNFRQVDLGQDQPILTKNGTFYQRAYHLRHACATPFRIKNIGLQIDIGTL